MDATKLKGGSNERPYQFVKRLEIIGSSLSPEKRGGAGARTSNRAGGGSFHEFTKGGVSWTVSPLAHAKAEGKERTGHGCNFSNLSLPR